MNRETMRKAIRLVLNNRVEKDIEMPYGEKWLVKGDTNNHLVGYTSDHSTSCDCEYAVNNDDDVHCSHQFAVILKKGFDELEESDVEIMEFLEENL